jgi:TrmH family RNA methyltransferase
MPFRIVQSKQNSRLKQLQRALAQPARAPGELAAIEGPKLLAEALSAGLRIHTVFAAQGFEQLLDGLPLPSETEVLLVPRRLLDAALATVTPQPIAALVKPPEWTWTHLLGSSHSQVPLLVVLAGLQDPGNLGTILRSAEAFGATGIISLPGTVSPWNPKAVRASAGSVFRVPLVATDPQESMKRLRKAGIKTLGATTEAVQPAGFADLAGPVAILIGNEGNGIPPDLAAQVDGSITIPCPGPVESLNAAVAASVLLYEASRQRAKRSESQRGLVGARR